MKKSYFLNVDNFTVSKKNMYEIKNQKNHLDLLPSKQIIQNLINYSKSLDVINLHSLGKIGLLSN